MNRFFKRIISAALCCFIISLTGCFEKDGSDGIIKYDIAFNPGSLDPQTANDAESDLIISSLYTGLLKVNPDGSLGAGVAEDYTVSDDGLVYSFKLCSDYFWTDVNGYEAPCTAKDFVYGFQRLFMKETRAPRASEYYCIKNSQAINLGAMSDLSKLGVEAVGDYELTITLDYPNPRFPVLLTEAPAMPCNEEYFIESQGRYGLSGGTTPSNGAFYLKTWNYDPYTPTDNNHLILRRNEKNSEANKVYPLGLNFFIEGDEDFTEDFLAGTISCIAVTDSQREQIKGEYTVQEYDAITVGLIMNKKFSLFKNADFRRALSLLVDRDRLAESISGYSPAYAVVPGEVTLLDQSYREFAGERMTPEYSTEKAQEYLQNALPHLDKGLFFGARIIMKDDPTAAAMISVIMQEWQRELGFYCVIETLDEAEFSERLSSGDYDIAVREISGSTNSPAAYLQYFASGSADNASGYSNSRVNQLMSAAERAKELSESAGYYQQAEQIILDDAAFIPLFYKNEFFYINKDFSDIYYNPFNKTVNFSQAKAF